MTKGIAHAVDMREYEAAWSFGPKHLAQQARVSGAIFY
jgi:hypothetical protein